MHRVGGTLRRVILCELGEGIKRGLAKVIDEDLLLPLWHLVLLSLNVIVWVMLNFTRICATAFLHLWLFRVVRLAFDVPCCRVGSTTE